MYVEFIYGDRLISKFRVNMQVWSVLTSETDGGSEQLLEYLSYFPATRL